MEPTAITLFVWPNVPVSWIGTDTGNGRVLKQLPRKKLNKDDHYGRKNKFKTLQSNSASHVT